MHCKCEILCFLSHKMVTCGNRNQTFVSIKRLVCTIIRTKNISEMFVLYHKICHIKYLITEGEISYWYVPEHYAILLYIQFHIYVLKSRVCATKTLSKSIQPWKIVLLMGRLLGGIIDVIPHPQLPYSNPESGYYLKGAVSLDVGPYRHLEQQDVCHSKLWCEATCS